jgi:hypothetical protein
VRLRLCNLPAAGIARWTAEPSAPMSSRVTDKRLKSRTEISGQCYRGLYNEGNQADLNLHPRQIFVWPGAGRDGVSSRPTQF